jgi:hypothetical protein
MEGKHLFANGNVHLPAAQAEFVHEGRARGLNLRRRPSNVLQCLFAQDIRIVFSGICKFDDLRSNGWSNAVVAVSNPQSDTDHFEGDTQDASIFSSPLSDLVPQ